MKLTSKNIKHLLKVLAISVLLSFFLTGKIKILEVDVMIVYLAALVGLSITIYTFGLSFLTPIIEQISKSKKIKEEDKKEVRDKLFTGYEELKEDVWVISYCLIGVIVVMIIEGCGWEYSKVIYIYLPVRAICFTPFQFVFSIIINLKVFFFHSNYIGILGFGKVIAGYFLHHDRNNAGE